MRISVLADTHLRSDARRHLPVPVLRVIERSDLLLHAGDIVTAEVLAELAAIVPTEAVCGNNDTELIDTLPETRSLVLANVRVALVHDSGQRAGRADRLARRFPDADIVIFGHSHLPVNEPGTGAQWLFNPGSPTLRRRAPFRSMGELLLADGEVREHRILPA